LLWLFWRWGLELFAGLVSICDTLSLNLQVARIISMNHWYPTPVPLFDYCCSSGCEVVSHIIAFLWWLIMLSIFICILAICVCIWEISVQILFLGIRWSSMVENMFNMCKSLGGSIPSTNTYVHTCRHTCIHTCIHIYIHPFF
jgi:hypothetical protein